MMDQERRVLRQILRMARTGSAFFTRAAPKISDVEVRDAFEHVAEVKNRLIADLRPFLSDEDQVEMRAERVSAAISMEKVYVDLERRFRGEAPAASARTLGLVEGELVRTVAGAFDRTHDAILHELLKTYYPQLVICREVMSRLRSRQAA
jgi:hypothetical protein